MQNTKVPTMINIKYLQSGTYFSENITKSCNNNQEDNANKNSQLSKKFMMSNAIKDIINSKEYNLHK